MKKAERASEVTVISNYSHTCEKLFGDRWISIGDAAVFLDPIFSSGVHVSISTAKFATEAILKARSLNVTLAQHDLGASYQQVAMKGVHRFHSLISMFYKDNFVALMKKTFALQKIRQGFTSAVAGDMWNDNNPLFEKNVL
jgi:flavin-dependent dehydrogenase